jgi:two-component system, NtrC family, response regulator HupR/HoxA
VSSIDASPPEAPIVRLAEELHAVRHIQRLLERRLGTRASVRGIESLPLPEAAALHNIPDGRPVVRVALSDGGELLSSPIRLAGAVIGEVRLQAPVEADARERELAADLIEMLGEEIGLAAAERRVDSLIEGPTRYHYDDLIGHSPPMRTLKRMLDKVIDSDSTVLVQGENGTGKELIARAIHFNSVRATHHFVVQNCSAFNDNLLDSELFGHKRGAFTGAIADKQGLFEVADRGSFFLDEIGDMSPTLQVKVLRVVQEGTFTPVGDTESRHVDVRLIAATHRDLRRMVDRGEFREDLFYRVNVINLVVPPLRERREDLPLLVDHFLEKVTRARRAKRKPRLSRACLDRLVMHAWPGNVRELENVLQRAIILAKGDAIAVSDLPQHIQDESVVSIDGYQPAGSFERQLREYKIKLAVSAVREHNGNKTLAARSLQISRAYLHRLLRSADPDGAAAQDLDQEPVRAKLELA